MDEIDFHLERAHRRTLTLHITRDGEVVVKAPYLMPEFMIRRFVSEKRDWISKHLQSIKKNQVKKVEQLAEGVEISYLGKIYPLHITQSDKISVTDRFNVPRGIMFRAKKELTNWYIKQAKQIITERVDHYAELMRLEYKSISYSDTRSKWGTCFVDNRLQFNWRLVMAPITVIDYVCVHELAHTREKNHRREFWKIVATYKPAYKQYIKWLRDNSPRLHAVL
jgi:predicted metal-dependent hydrolase